MGDADGWRVLAQVYGPVVYGWARRAGCQSADAADVMQETFVSVSKAIAGFDYRRDGATFRGWLWTITRNKIRDRNRNLDRRGAQHGAGGTAAHLVLDAIESPELPDPLDSVTHPPSEFASDAAMVRRRMLELIRTEFEPRVWQMFWETAVEGREPIDVADQLGVSKWAVYKARARVLNKLKTELDGIG